jgi:RNA-splicing ligase RtcB
MNRDAIIELWSNSQGINHTKMGSHSHDNITAELHNGSVKMVHRNGVQNIGQDKYCILPSAMGNYSYVMLNSFNEEAYFSTNHGTGRMQDKHIARDCYTEAMTTEEMKKARVSLFRVGNGNLAEQNMHAFKEPTGIVEEMERNKLARRSAKTQPMAVIKG